MKRATYGYTIDVNSLHCMHELFIQCTLGPIIGEQRELDPHQSVGTRTIYQHCFGNNRGFKPSIIQS